MSDLLTVLRLTLIADDRMLAGGDLVEACRAATRGGVTSVLLRLREASPRELTQAARALRSALEVPVLVGGRADVAVAVRAAGVHLDPDDVPVPVVRRIVPRGFLIGASVCVPEDAETGRGADYWAIGPCRMSRTSQITVGDRGVAEFAWLRRLAEGRPCIAFGEIPPAGLSAVTDAGGCGIAIGPEILSAPELEAAARRYSGYGAGDRA